MASQSKKKAIPPGDYQVKLIKLRIIKGDLVEAIRIASGKFQGRIVKSRIPIYKKGGDSNGNR